MWKNEIEELERRKQAASELGGEENVAKQHRAGKMTVRERIDSLADGGSFLERGILAGVPSYDKEKGDKLIDITPCPLVTGIMKVDRRRIAVTGDDYTIKGASVGRMYKAKNAYFAKMARRLKLPVVRLLEGAGGSIKEILDIGYTELPTWNDEAIQDQVDMMSEVPVVAAGFGAIAGLAAMYLVQSHFSIMVKGHTQVFVGGPPLVRAACAEDLSKEELGGYKIHGYVSGVVDNIAETEEESLQQIKTFLSYLPANVWNMPPIEQSVQDDPKRKEEDLVSIIPKNGRKIYDMRRIIDCIVDRGSFFEIGKYQGRSQITGLARMNGYPVGLLANDPRFLAGSFSHDVSEKFIRFVDMCDTFHLPIINLSDQPGFTIGLKNEIHGNIRKGVRASFAMAQARVPLAVIYVRKCFGVAGAAQKTGMQFCWRYAWPSAVWGNIPVEGGVYAAHRKEIESAEDPKAYLDTLQDTYRTVSSPFRTAENFGIEDIINPKDTRQLLCEWVEIAYEVEKDNLGIKKRGMRM